MRLLTYVDGGDYKPGVLRGETVHSLHGLYPSVLALLEAGERGLDAVRSALEAGRLPAAGAVGDLRLGPPVRFPRKMLCVAGNYRDHILEGGRAITPEFTQAPWLFCVPPTTLLIGHREEIRLNPNHRKTDYEGELAIVIGRTAKRVKAERAHEYIAGYTIYNDVSERSPFMIEHVEQPRQLSFWYGKSFDTYGPIGPHLVTADEVPDPQDLTIRVRVNGEERQNCSTSQMIFNVFQLVEFLTSFLTLEPGDTIATGTPSGVGAATGKFLNVGDVVSIEIDRLGVLENRVVVDTE